MKITLIRALALAASLAALHSPVLAATSAPAPPKLVYPNMVLHTEVVVEVNRRGQVVRVKSTKPCKVQSFNVQTFGNALQMWIRRPNGTAQVGLYRVSYDYNPKTQRVARKISLVSLGGNWGNDQGAATIMMDTARKQAAEMRKLQQQQPSSGSKLPSLNEIRGATPSPKPGGTPQPH